MCRLTFSIAKGHSWPIKSVLMLHTMNFHFQAKHAHVPQELKIFNNLLGVSAYKALWWTVFLSCLPCVWHKIQGDYEQQKAVTEDEWMDSSFRWHQGSKYRKFLTVKSLICSQDSSHVVQLILLNDEFKFMPWKLHPWFLSFNLS